MPSSLGRSLGKRVGNALVRHRRDLRFVLIDRYRALLASPYAAATALVSGAVDVAFDARRRVARLRLRRGAVTGGPRLLRAAVGADALSVVVTGGRFVALGLRLGEQRWELPTLADTDPDAVRLVAQLPADLADGADRTVTVDGADVVVADPDVVPASCTVRDGRLVLRGRPGTVSAVAHTLEVGVRTVVVRWAATAGDRLLVGGVETLARTDADVCTAELDLLDLVGTSPVIAGGGGSAPLGLAVGRWPADARPDAPPPVRVNPPGGHPVEIAYTAEGHLQFRATEAAWSP